MQGQARSSKKWLVLLALPVILMAGLWWQGSAILEWHYVRGLANADDSDREMWAGRVAGLDLAVLPRLLTILRGADASACDNVEVALVSMLCRWGHDDPRSRALVEDLLGHFPDLGREGQHAVLRVPIFWLGQSQASIAPADVTLTVGNYLTASSGIAELRDRALELAQSLVQRSRAGQWWDLCKDLAVASLTDAQADTRCRAIKMLLHFSQADPRLLAEVAPLLRDSSVEVRRSALIAVGPSRDVVGDDELLPLLHDDDGQVRRLCEEALRSRGLLDSHLLLARLISNPSPGARLQVVTHLVQAEDLEPGIWLRRLSHDSAPAVRAAAVRAAYFQTQVDLRDRLRQMASEDPSPTVRQLADHYLRRPPVLPD